MSLEEALVKSLYGKSRVRPTLGDMVNISALRAYLMLLEISPGMRDLHFFAGRKYGEEFAKHLGRKGSLRKGIRALFKYLENTRLTIPELVSCTEKEAVVRGKECATSYGLPNIGTSVCWFESGVISGFLSAYTGRRMIAREVKCNADGSEYCEFVITPVKFEEKFREALTF